MSTQLTIELNGIRIFGQHGMYEEERLVGNEFEVSISVRTKTPKDKIISLDQTISYVEIYRIAKDVLQTRQQLLETCAMEIAEQLKYEFHDIRNVAISIWKINPPITSSTGKVGISYKKSFR